MTNIVIIVGRITAEPELRITKDGKKVSSITVACTRPYKNTNGEYEADFITCILWDYVATNVTEYCHKGDLVGIKGRIQTRTYEVNNEKRKVTEIIAERVTFLSSKSKEINKKLEETKENDNTSAFEEFGEQLEIDTDKLLD